MRVISTQPDKSVVKKKICHHCGATLEYVPNDIQKHTGMDIDGTMSITEYLMCGNCNKEINLRSY